MLEPVYVGGGHLPKVEGEPADPNFRISRLPKVGDRVRIGDQVVKMVSWDYTYRTYSEEVGGIVRAVHLKKGDKIVWGTPVLALEIEVTEKKVGDNN